MSEGSNSKKKSKIYIEYEGPASIIAKNFTGRDELFFEKLSWGKNESRGFSDKIVESKMEKNTKNTSKSPGGNIPRMKLYVNNNDSTSKREKLTQKLKDSPEEQVEDTEKPTKRKDMDVVSFFTMLGRIINFTKRIKEKLFLSDPDNLNELQIRLINDKTNIIEGVHNSPIITRSQTIVNRQQTMKKLKKRKNRQVSFWVLLSKYIAKIKMFHPLSRFLIAWKGITCMSILFEIFSISISLFFQRNWDKDYSFIYIYEAFLKAILILDMFVICNTGIFLSGSVIFSRREAIKNYLKKKFGLDLIGLIVLFIPYFNYTPSQMPESPAFLCSTLNLIKILFLTKLHQLSGVFKYLEEMLYIDEMYEGILSLAKLFIKIIVISHFIACAWNYAAMSERDKGSNSWIDKTFSQSLGNNISSINWSTSYLYAWYWSLATMITVGYGDISPCNDKEVIVASLAMIFGCGFFAYAINNIGSIFEKFSQRKKNLR